MTEESKLSADGLLIVERATTGSGEFIGLRLTLPESDKITLVFADQKAMPGFRYGKEFIPDFGETVRYADELSQLREELAQRDAEVERLRRFEAAYIEWQEKTEWVQADAKPKELGKHRADVLRERIDALSVNHRKSGFCGDPYVHDCGRNDCPLSDSYAGHANKVAGEKGNAN